MISFGYADSNPLMKIDPTGEQDRGDAHIPSPGSAGPAHDHAKRGEQWIPFDECCPCEAGGGSPR
jgi:hypothetical protein